MAGERRGDLSGRFLPGLDGEVQNVLPGRCGRYEHARRLATGLAQVHVKLLYFGLRLLWESTQSGRPVFRRFASPFEGQPGKANFYLGNGAQDSGRDR